MKSVTLIVAGCLFKCGYFLKTSQTVISDLHFSNSPFELNMCYVSGVLKLDTAL